MPTLIHCRSVRCALVLGWLLCQQAALADFASPSPTPLAQQNDPAAETLSEVVVRAAEPRFVAPTRRDRIGRIWAPVYINDHGPFRLVLDSGANHTGINAQVAEALGLTPDQTHPVMLRGVTGSATVLTVRVDKLLVGDMQMGASDLPILTDPLGGADGILGIDEMSGRRISVDFRHDQIIIVRSHNEPAPPGFRTIPFRLLRGNLLAVEASIGDIPVTAIIDTGGQATIANLALRKALDRQRIRLNGHRDLITGVTAEVQEGNAAPAPPLVMRALERNADVEIRYGDVTFADMRIFEHWHLTREPVMLVGMDALGLLDTLIIDYRRRELQVQIRDGS